MTPRSYWSRTRLNGVSLVVGAVRCDVDETGQWHDVPAGVPQQHLEVVGRDGVVVVQQGHEPAPGDGDAGVACETHPGSIDQLDQPNVELGVVRGEGVDHGAGAVGRTVEDDDDLEQGGVDRLAAQGLQAAAQVRGTLV